MDRNLVQQSKEKTCFSFSKSVNESMVWWFHKQIQKRISKHTSYGIRTPTQTHFFFSENLLPHRRQLSADQLSCCLLPLNNYTVWMMNYWLYIHVILSFNLLTQVTRLKSLFMIIVTFRHHDYSRSKFKSRGETWRPSRAEEYDKGGKKRTSRKAESS